MDTSEKRDDDAGVERPARRMRTLEEKLAIVQEAMRPGASVALVARKHGMNANLLFGWLRLHRRGLLESQRHGKPPLLPVKITSPTITPTRRSSVAIEKPRARGKDPGSTTMAESFIEIVVGSEARIRLHGDAGRELLARLLEWLPSR